MRRRIEALADRFEEFVSEDDHDCLLITCSDDGVGLVGAAVDLTEQRGSIDVSIPFFEPFVDAEGLAHHVATVADGLAELAAHERVAGQTIIERATSLATALARLGDVRVVLWLVPSRVESTHGYLETVRTLVREASTNRTRVRLAIRDLDGGAATRALRGDGHRLLEATLDTTRAGFRDAFLEEAEDLTVSVEARCAALLTVANIAVAEGRADVALPLLGHLATIYAAQGDGSSRALCFLLAANALVHLGRDDEARERARQAFAIAAEASAVAVAVSSASLAGHLAIRAREIVEAEHHFDVGARLAGALGAGVIVCDLLTQRAGALEELGRPEAARDALHCAVEAARRVNAAANERIALRQLLDVELDRDVLAAIGARIRELEVAPAIHDCHGHAS